jgi:hypothetical protein
VHAHYGIGAEKDRHLVLVGFLQSAADDVGGFLKLVESLGRKTEAATIVEVIVEDQKTRI